MIPEYVEVLSGKRSGLRLNTNDNESLAVILELMSETGILKISELPPLSNTSISIGGEDHVCEFTLPLFMNNVSPNESSGLNRRTLKNENNQISRLTFIPHCDSRGWVSLSLIHI